jgi:uroporphyrinogen decarboxylase
VVGVDFRVPLDVASARLGGRYPVQGNLDPAILAAGPEVVRNRTLQTLEAGSSAPGHVFNLGHGVPPGTDPDVLQLVVDTVHSWSAS